LLKKAPKMVQISDKIGAKLHHVFKKLAKFSKYGAKPSKKRGKNKQTGSPFLSPMYLGTLIMSLVRFFVFI